ncbi:MAG: hypothetical protein D3920_09245 [Candidatus Electrothrix sp. AW2]|nr:hypothetical protein [Candidatus Electrothrix gigas]
MKKSTKPSFLVEFLIETLIGISIFVIIAIAAVVLSFFVAYLKDSGVDPVITTGLTIGEYFIFTCDIFLFHTFLFRQTQKTWNSLKSESIL